MPEERTEMECIALSQYAPLIQALGGDEVRALEIVCGVFRSGDMRGRFLDSVFGGEVQRAEEQLEAKYTGDAWRRNFPSLAAAADYVHTGVQETVR